MKHFYIVFVVIASCLWSSRVCASDRGVLIELYYAASGANWTNNTNWLSDKPLDDWHGVTVRDERVVGLDLDGLRGTIPEILSNLSSLEVLSLKGHLLGPISEILGKLSNLKTLSLSGNLRAPIPRTLVSLNNLKTLSLNGGLEGPIPDWLSKLSSLEHLDLSGNQFSEELPQDLTYLLQLSHIALDPTNCVPDTPAFTEWLAKIKNTRVTSCSPPAPDMGTVVDQVTARSKEKKEPRTSWNLNVYFGPYAQGLADDDPYGYGYGSRLEYSFKKLTGGVRYGRIQMTKNTPDSFPVEDLFVFFRNRGRWYIGTEIGVLGAVLSTGMLLGIPIGGPITFEVRATTPVDAIGESYYLGFTTHLGYDF